MNPSHKKRKILSICRVDIINGGSSAVMYESLDSLRSLAGLTELYSRKMQYIFCLWITHEKEIGLKIPLFWRDTREYLHNKSYRDGKILRRWEDRIFHENCGHYSQFFRKGERFPFPLTPPNPPNPSPAFLPAPLRCMKFQLTKSNMSLAVQFSETERKKRGGRRVGPTPSQRGLIEE